MRPKFRSIGLLAISKDDPTIFHSMDAGFLMDTVMYVYVAFINAEFGITH